MANIIINRLTILKGGSSVYDQRFHIGVNIIRGENGVGKSTILNSIYYLLGGDFSKWLPEIERCDSVVGEVEFNSKIFTIRREITRVPMQQMHIYFGTMEEGNKEARQWVPYSYKRSSKGDSFSQLLFKALEFPEVETEDDDYITFNQALRLMYIDQTSPLDELMKDIEFDSPLIRKTISDLLLGVYDNSLFRQQLLLKELKKTFIALESELKLLKSVYNTNDNSIDLNNINNKIREAEERLTVINSTLNEKGFLLAKATTKRDKKLTELQLEISKESEQLKKALDEQKTIELDSIDTQDFISELQRQILALEESANIRSILGQLEVSFCPSCLKPIPHSIDTDNCKLCKEPLELEVSNSRIFRIKEQLMSQISESQILLEQNRQSHTSLVERITGLKQSIRIKQNEINRYIQDNDSDRNSTQDLLLIEKGRLLQQIENFSNDLKTANKYWSIYKAFERNKSEIERLTETIKDKQQRQVKKYQTAIDRINYYSKELLKGDGSYESEFITANYISLDFYKNTYAVDGRNNFSASSLVVLKNSVRLGIFFASLDLDFMRYPKFIICDNIEDKGMNEKRSKNFQKNLVRIANSEALKEKKFQIIYSTSMIEETLNSNTYTIGEYYTPENKALKFDTTK